MLFAFKKIFSSLLINGLFFIILILAIQNSSEKTKVYLLSRESIDLPVSFVLSTSLILGSITGSSIFIKNQ